MSIRAEDSIVVATPRRNIPDLLLSVAPVAIALCVLLGVAAGIVLYTVPRATAAAGAVLWVCSLLATGITAVVLVFLAARMTRQMERLRDSVSSLEQRTAILAEQSVARAQALNAQRPALEPAELRAILLDIRETLLLPEADRNWRFQKLVEREFDRRLALAEQFIVTRDFHRARAELLTLVERFGRTDRVGAMEDRLERAAEAARANDIAQISQHVQDLMGLARWDDAERAARELADKYPVASEPANLLIRVQRERTLFEQRHRQRLHDEIQQFVHQRRWREAAEAARRFIENFPKGVDTDALRTQLETLEANADIQARQELERQLKEHVRNHQYWDAVDLARRIIADHPLSPQANALRNQIGRLEELARTQEPQR